MTDLTLEESLEKLGGCGDGNCQVYVRPGMHTNGGCKCLRHDPLLAERVLYLHKKEIKRLRAEMVRLYGVNNTLIFQRDNANEGGQALRSENEALVEKLSAARDAIKAITSSLLMAVSLLENGKEND